jgi:hypothetical protein
VGVYDGLPQPVEAAGLRPGPAGQLYAYLYSAGGQLEVLDVSNPAKPVKLGRQTLAEGQWLPASDFLLTGRYAYLYDQVAGSPTVIMVDLANPARPVKAGNYQTDGQVRAVQAGPEGVYAYIIDADYNLRVVDLSNPAAPRQANLYDAPENIVGLAAGERAIYLMLEPGLDHQVIQRLDITDLAAPQAVGRYELSTLSGWPMVIGDNLYLQSGRPVLRVTDVSDPANPVEVSASPLPQSPSLEQLFAAPGRLYLVEQQAGVSDRDPAWLLHVIDVTNPAAPVIGGVLTPDPPALYRVLAAAGGALYFVDRQGQVRLVNVSNPAAPQEIGPTLNFGSIPYLVESAALAGNKLYLGLNQLGLAIFELP